MSDKGQHRDDPASRERLARLGLAVERSRPDESCPDAERFAEMLDAEAGSAVHRAFLEHLSVCEPCLQKWLVLSSELDRRSKDLTGAAPWFKRRRLLTGVGSACGLALAAVLYLAVDYRPLHYDGGDAQLAEESSSGSTIAPPADRPRPETGLDADEQLENRRFPPSPKSELVLEAGKTRQKAAPPPRIEEQSTNADSAPIPSVRVKKEAAAGAADLLERHKSVPPGGTADQGAAAPEVTVTAKSSRMAEAKYRSVVGEGLTSDTLDYRNFIDAVAGLCGSDRAGFTAEGAEPVREQGRALLVSEARPTGERRALVEELVTFLEKEITLDDKEWIELCKRVRMITEQEQNGDMPERGSLLQN